jgi:hypothetical protein
MRPTLVIQQPTRERVSELRSGLGEVENVVVLGMEAKTFSTLPGLDALYMSLTRAERFGSRPLPPHEVAVLDSGRQGADEGVPPLLIVGLVLEEHEPNTAHVCVPLIVRAVLRAAAEHNARWPGAIRTIGFTDFELTFPGASLPEVGRAFAASLQ